MFSHEIIPLALLPILFIFYIGVIIFVLWLALRLVRAVEKIADKL